MIVMSEADAKTCPSAPPEPGSVLLGVVTGPGAVAYLNPHVRVDEALLDGIRRRGVAPDNRLRFACACAEHRCVQWKGDSGAGRCGLVEEAVDTIAAPTGPLRLPRCGIRATCRWFAQRGRDACAICPTIIRRPAPAAGRAAPPGASARAP